MKKIIFTIAAFMLLFSGHDASAQECEFPIGIYLDNRLVDMPEASMAVLENALKRVATQTGINSGLEWSQFVLTAKVDILDRQVVPGPPTQIVNNLGLTLYIVDMYDKQIFSSEYIEIDGVGTNETKSFTDAFRRVNASNAKVGQIISSGKKKVLDYYDRQYPNILNEAKRKADMQQYEEALALASAIPACSRGGDEAVAVALDIYTRYLDKVNLMLLNRAKSIWAAGQDPAAAAMAAEMLADIDPEAGCYREAQSLMKEIKSQMRSDIDFEMREKYKDQVKLENDRIAAIRAIGVAYGNGQKPTTTNIAWIR